MQVGKLTQDRLGSKQLVITRVFNAPRDLVVQAHTQPAYVRRWLLGPPGWEMPTCEMDLRVGGRYRWEWSNAERKMTMGLGGEYLELDLPRFMRVTQRFDDAWDGQQSEIFTEFLEQGAQTILKMTITYESEAILEKVMTTPMANGMEMGYERLESLLKQMEGEAA
ncbi:SRPBCC domain-containing protein [Terriglobus tenax]|uniref:SRPBCC domain-containing protein n=1 Tax=Terriglobus tenax TaxID=1111115 RepID=UPI0021E056DD|nr:SRPBCC domain-containing protein [Terriglobus tenax]